MRKSKKLKIAITAQPEEAHPGDYRIFAHLDPNDRFAESDETDNAFLTDKLVRVFESGLVLIV